MALPGGEVNSARTRLKAIIAADRTQIEQCELVINGDATAIGDKSYAEHNFEAPVGGWIAARFWAAGKLVAHTSPIYITSKNETSFVDLAAIEFLDGHLTRARDWVVTEGRFNNPKSRERLLGIFDAARDKLNASAKRR